MEKAHCLDSEESRWWALKFCFKCPTLFVLDARWGLEYTSVRGTAPFLSLAFQPPRLLYGRAANYGSFIVLSEGMIFSFQGTSYSFGLLPVWGVALAVTIVYLKTECFFRMHSFRFLDFFSPKKQQNRKLSFRFHIDTFDFFATKKEAGERSPTSHRFIIRSQSPLQMPEAVRQMIL